MDIDQDVLFWNAHAFLNSQLLSAKKIWVTLTAVEESVRRGFNVHQEEIPIPFDEKWRELCSDSSSLASLIQEGLSEVGLEDVLPIIEGNPGSKLVDQFCEKLSWALDVQACWAVWRHLGLSSEEINEKLQETWVRLQRLTNDRPRLLFLQKMGPKTKPVDVEFYRADFTDLPFLENDKCFFLASKFSDQPLPDMLPKTAGGPPAPGSVSTAFGALASKYDGLHQHIWLLEQAGRTDDYVSVANPDVPHALHVFHELPNEDVPFGLAVIDVGTKTRKVDQSQLYQDLMCLDKILLQQNTTHLLTVLIGFGPKVFDCFQDVTVEGTLTQLQRLIEYLARHVRTLRRVTVATFNAQTATELRAFLAKGDTVSELSIDELRRRILEDDFSKWLESLDLQTRVAAFLQKAMQTVVDKKEYHTQLCSSIRDLVGHFVKYFLMAEFGIYDAYVRSQRNRFGVAVHVMAGQVAHWMRDHCAVIAVGDDRQRLSSICTKIKSINARYVNMGAHPEALTEEKLSEMDGISTEIFQEVSSLLFSAFGWHPVRTSDEVLKQLATSPSDASPSRARSRPSWPRELPGSPEKVRVAKPGLIAIHRRGGKVYHVDAGHKYSKGGRPVSVCTFFAEGKCTAKPGMCRFAHPCRFQAKCSQRATCIFDHPDDLEETPVEVPALEKYEAQVCRFFMKSHCRFAEKCIFAHPCSVGSSCADPDCRLDHPI